MRSLTRVALVRIATLIAVSPLVLSACGQRGALYLPNDEHARDNRAVYMFYHAPADQQQDKTKTSAKAKKDSIAEKSSNAPADATTPVASK